jgi:hypothetical protein
MKKQTQNRFWITTSCLALSWLATACGGQSSRDFNNSNVPGAQAPGNGNGGYWSNYPNPNPTNTSNPTPSPTSTSGGGSSSNLPPLAYDFTISGAGGSKPTYTSPAIQTDSILKVRVTAGPAGQLSASNVAYSNFSSTYGCISYTVEAIGQQVQTKALNVGYSYGNVCGAAAADHVIDFSGRLTPGHGAVNLKVTAARYSFYCELLAAGWVYGSYSMFCPLHTVYKNHTVTGRLEVQVNGTSGF